MATFSSFVEGEHFKIDKTYNGYKIFLKDIPGLQCTLNSSNYDDDNGEWVHTYIYTYNDISITSCFTYSIYSNEKITSDILNTNYVKTVKIENEGEPVTYEHTLIGCRYKILLDMAKKAEKNRILSKDEIEEMMEMPINSKSFVIDYGDQVNGGKGNGIDIPIYIPNKFSNSPLDRILCNEPNNRSLTVSMVALGKIPENSTSSIERTLRMSMVSNKELYRNGDNTYYGIKTQNEVQENAYTLTLTVTSNPIPNKFCSDTSLTGVLRWDANNNMVVFRTGSYYRLLGKYLITFSWTDDSNVTPEPQQETPPT